MLRVASGVSAQVAVMPRSSDRVARLHGVAGRVQRDWAAAGSTGVVAGTASRIR